MTKIEDTLKLQQSLIADLEGLIKDIRNDYQDKINEQKKMIDLLNEIIVEHCNGKKERSE